jgi:signal transduction histidine kinase
MAALELIGIINQLLFIGLFAAVLRRALRQPSRAHTDAALLFGAIAAAVVSTRVVGWLGLGGEPWVVGLELMLLNTAPFAMLRLVDDFRGTPPWVQWTGTAAFAIVSIVGFLNAPSVTIAAVGTIGLFVAVGGYAAFAFTVEARRTRGITQRRMTAVAAGAFAFIGAIVALFLGAVFEPLAPASGLIGQLAALAAVIAFFLGFTPPAWIRRAWREPDLRRFLERSLHLPGMADERAALLDLERAAAAAFGASGASVGLADPDRGVLRYPTESGWSEYQATDFVAGRAYTEQRRIVALDAPEVDPSHAEVYRSSGATTIIAAPVSTEERRIGVLAVYADRAPLFVDDDLWLLELLADQAAVLLQARSLASDAGELRAREEATRLKEEFLSAAAHDLRTPLTVVLGQAELLERRVARDPEARVDAAGAARMAKEARRLRDLVSDLLDAQRLEEARSIMNLRPHDLRIVVEEVGQRYAEQGVELSVELPTPTVIALADAVRLEQVLDNLVDNALKYGRQGGRPEISLTVAGDVARLAVVDHGIGVPDAERGRVFDRFFRASNAHSITDTGMGLGLAICRRIVEEHDGRIEHAPTPGGGSTFTVTLPLIPRPEVTTDPVTVPDRGPQPSTGLATEAVADA